MTGISTDLLCRNNRGSGFRTGTGFWAIVELRLSVAVDSEGGLDGLSHGAPFAENYEKKIL